MDNVIGYKGTKEDRQINWRVLSSLKGQLNFYKDQPNNTYTVARDKQSKAYNRFFKEYIS